MKRLILQHKTGLLKMFLILLWGIGCFVFFQTEYKYHFFYEEQNQLFLMDCEYWLSYLQKPAWLACLTGDFLTQFYYYLYAGAFIITGVLLVLGDLLRRDLELLPWVKKAKDATRSRLGWGAFAVAIAVISVEARLYLDENYRLDSIIALCGGAAVWYIYALISRMTDSWWKRCLILLPLLPLTYWLFGRGVMVLGVLELLSLSPVTAVMAALMCFGISRLAVPCYHVSSNEALNYPGGARWQTMEYVRDAERKLHMDNEYYFGNYAEAIRFYEAQKDGLSESMTFYYSLSLARLGILPEKMAEMKEPYLGTFVTIGPDTPIYIIKMINDLYWVLGDMTYTERAALLANTFSPKGRNARMIKRLAEANLVSGDTIAARKYLRLLDKTLVYAQWAEDHDPSNMTETVKTGIAGKKAFANTTDKIRLGDDCYTIMTQLLESNPHNTVALHYLLCSDMLAKNRLQFIYDYERYGSAGNALFTQIYNQAKGN